MQNYNTPRKDPVEVSRFLCLEQFVLTGPRRSGMYIWRMTTLIKIQKKPKSVTMFGASHRGRTLTKAFHYKPIKIRILGK